MWHTLSLHEHVQAHNQRGRNAGLGHSIRLCVSFAQWPRRAYSSRQLPDLIFIVATSPASINLLTPLLGTQITSQAASPCCLPRSTNII